MRIKYFEIRNFKGIANTTIHLENGAPGNVVTLIGLNESGKTTILEALSNFISADSETAHLVGTVSKKIDVRDFVPKDRKAAFTGEISISANIIIEEQDIRHLAAFLLNEHGAILNQSDLQKNTTASRSYGFVDSEHKKTMHFWEVSFRIKQKGARKFEDCFGHAGSKNELKVLWIAAVQFLAGRLPRVVYFPTFLFEFPARIYLENDVTSSNRYYRQVIEDIIKSMPGGLSMQKHIIDRLNRVREPHKDPATFLSHLFQRDEKQQIDALLHKLSDELTRTVLGAWRQILGKSTQNRRVQIDWGLEPSKSNAIYLEISIVDPSSKYRLSERSLGFRWFFAFLLFTQFRSSGREDQTTIFLFDEPAANLHSRAQMKLAETFTHIARGNTQIIYSTHSHYMINPFWLEKAYIIENKAMDFDANDETDLSSASRTVIDAVRYRTFVGSYPRKTTYFQPILDTLKVGFSPLVRSARALIVEGKNDFHPLVYLQRRSGGDGTPDIFPVGGAGNAGELISLFRGWGIDFRVILDDDKAGRQAQDKYKDSFLLRENEIVTLGQISNQLTGKTFEAIYQSDVLSLVKAKFNIPKPSKKHFAIYFQELLANDTRPELVDTLRAFEPISAWIKSAFSDER